MNYLKLLLAPDGELLYALCTLTKVEAISEASVHLMTLFKNRQQEQRLILWAVRKELSETSTYHLFNVPKIECPSFCSSIGREHSL